MAREKHILLGHKGHRRRKLGPTARKLRFFGILFAVILFVGFSTQWMSNRRRVHQAQLDISRIAHAARLFRADFGRCPDSIDELITPPEGSAYLRKMTDPWGHPYKLQCPSFVDNEDVEVVSFGPDGEQSGKDDVKTFFVELNL